jgi:hypothetical protein
MRTNENYHQTKENVARVMADQGWDRVDDLSFRATAAIALKQYDTAVGVKEAVAYFTSVEPGTEQLTVHYESEGRNITEPMSINFPASATEEDVRPNVFRFCNAIERRIDDSYARRLNRPKEPSDECEP